MRAIFTSTGVAALLAGIAAFLLGAAQKLKFRTGAADQAVFLMRAAAVAVQLPVALIRNRGLDNVALCHRQRVAALVCAAAAAMPAAPVLAATAAALLPA